MWSTEIDKEVVIFSATRVIFDRVNKNKNKNLTNRKKIEWSQISISNILMRTIILIDHQKIPFDHSWSSWSSKIIYKKKYLIVLCTCPSKSIKMKSKDRGRSYDEKRIGRAKKIYIYIDQNCHCVVNQNVLNIFTSRSSGQIAMIAYRVSFVLFYTVVDIVDDQVYCYYCYYSRETIVFRFFNFSSPFLFVIAIASNEAHTKRNDGIIYNIKCTRRKTCLL